MDMNYRDGCTALQWACLGGFVVYKFYKRWWKEARLDGEGRLPPELILEILSRLDVKQLLRCKSVCKQWNALTEGRYFTNMFMSRQPKTYICNYLVRQAKTRSYTMTVSTCDGLKLDCAYFTRFWWSRMTPSLSLTNPETHQRLHIPAPNDTDLDAFYALSFIPSTGDYKIVSIYSVDDKDICVVLTLGDTCKWRALDIPDSLLTQVSMLIETQVSTRIETNKVVHVGTDIHCIRNVKVKSHYVYEIRSLDLESECFHVDFIVKRNKFIPIKWDSYLAFVYGHNDHLHVLVLEDYKKHKWADKFVVSTANFVKEQRKENVTVLTPLVAQHGLLWFLRSDHAYLGYNLKTHRLEVTFPRQSDVHPLPQVFCHVPSAVSLKGMRTY